MTYYKNDEEVKLDSETLWSGLGGLCGLFLVSVFVFVALMDRKYLGTFMNSTTGPQQAVEMYHTFTSDERRVETFDQHPKYYEGVKVELKALIDENWVEWMESRPEWLTDAVIESIPDEYLRVAPVVSADEIFVFHFTKI